MWQIVLIIVLVIFGLGIYCGINMIGIVLKGVGRLISDIIHSIFG